MVTGDSRYTKGDGSDMVDTVFTAAVDAYAEAQRTHRIYGARTLNDPVAQGHVSRAYGVASGLTHAYAIVSGLAEEDAFEQVQESWLARVGA